ncbi:hypothetical protein F3K40_08230 [Streptomyces sp. LBUM 1478]|uniref:hypothetical protein n=1 Tax=Streptomyces scabiei TaxID=1930 RepID=UPI000765F3A2|nr:hypothetical protein [Streptomyces scabiei]MBP5905757.1 hypothetical protein [Streptomyces sp. LBUM 1478]
MSPTTLHTVSVRVAEELGVHPDAAARALRAALDLFRAQAHHPAIVNAGITPAEYLGLALKSDRFKAMLIAATLTAAGRDADARLTWTAYLDREMETTRLAQQAVPANAILGNPDAIHRVGRQLGLADEHTDRLIPGLVFTIATGYPYRSAGMRHLSLTDVLAQLTAEDLTELLQHAALVDAGRAEEAAVLLRRIQHAP